MHPLWHKALVIFIPGLSPPTDTQIYNPPGAVCPWYYFEGRSHNLNGKCHTKMGREGGKRKGKGREGKET